LDAGRAGDRLFLLMCGVGPDAHIVEGLHSVRNGHITRLAYAKPILHTLRKYDYPEIKLYFTSTDPTCDNPPPVSARWVEAVNLPLYALGLRFAPEGVGIDGMLDVCAFRGAGRARSLWFFSQVAIGRHPRMGDCSVTRCRGVRIESDREVPYQLDGDPAGRLPVEIDVVPGRLTILVSPRTARSLGFACGEPQTA
jgi:diacylglycerol kinase family enzyme